MRRLLRPALAVAAALLFVVPLVLMVTGSLRAAGLPPPRGPELLPDPVTLSSYERAFELVDLGRYAANSVLVAGIAVPLAVLLASWAGFAIFLDASAKPANSRVFLDTIPVIRRVPTVPEWPEIEDAAEQVLEEALYEGATPGEVARELDAATRSIWARVQR